MPFDQINPNGPRQPSGWAWQPLPIEGGFICPGDARTNGQFIAAGTPAAARFSSAETRERLRAAIAAKTLSVEEIKGALAMTDTMIELLRAGFDVLAVSPDTPGPLPITSKTVVVLLGADGCTPNDSARARSLIAASKSPILNFGGPEKRHYEMSYLLAATNGVFGLVIEADASSHREWIDFLAPLVKSGQIVVPVVSRHPTNAKDIDAYAAKAWGTRFLPPIQSARQEPGKQAAGEKIESGREAVEIDILPDDAAPTEGTFMVEVVVEPLSLDKREDHREAALAATLAGVAPRCLACGRAISSQVGHRGSHRGVLRRTQVANSKADPRRYQRALALDIQQEPPRFVCLCETCCPPDADPSASFEKGVRAEMTERHEWSAPPDALSRFAPGSKAKS